MKRESAYIFSLIQLFFLAWTAAYAQISPGELAKVHSHLEGMSNCTKCHILGKKVSNQKCLDCHTELKVRIDFSQGYHSSAEIKDKECVVCHSDHHGMNFQIIRFSKEKFNHGLTGFNLLGAHGQKQCNDCHRPEHIKDQRIKKKKFTYLGLNKTCLTCHDDYHQQTLSVNCIDCHAMEAFKPAGNFNHSRARFQLSGKHRDVPCSSCHTMEIKNGKKYQVFKGVQYSGCINCHKDPHNNKFGQNCKQCHSELSFVAIKGVQNFDHNKTGFKLEGKHQGITCEACHKTKLTNALQYGRCTNCHADYHKNQFVKDGAAPDCSHCHTVYGFNTFTFTTEQHSESVFPLKGAHLATPCFACHKKGTTDTIWSFREIGRNCVDCHLNFHQTSISEKYFPGSKCEVCHTENRWNLINFDHKRTSFELTGAHAAVSCRNCHFKKDGEGIVNQRFAGLSMNCVNCHPDIHMKQFEQDSVTDCSRCHDPGSFKPASKFDHGKTRFPLDGKHNEVACIKCHKTIQDKGSTFVLYKIKEFRCENCHH
jgi:hypothetical protein